MATTKYTSQDVRRFQSKINATSDDACWEWQAGCYKNGYGLFQWHGSNRRAHRIAWELVNGEIPSGLMVLHTCDNRKCCNPSHLFLGTHQDNMNDRDSKGRQARGSAVIGKRHTKLTKSQVQEIRRRYALGDITQQELAEEFGVHRTMIGDIVRMVYWK